MSWAIAKHTCKPETMRQESIILCQDRAANILSNNAMYPMRKLRHWTVQGFAHCHMVRFWLGHSESTACVFNPLPFTVFLLCGHNSLDSHRCLSVHTLSVSIVIREDPGNCAMLGAPGNLPVTAASEIPGGHTGGLAFCTMYTTVIETECLFSCAI